MGFARGEMCLQLILEIILHNFMQSVIVQQIVNYSINKIVMTIKRIIFLSHQAEF